MYKLITLLTLFLMLSFTMIASGQYEYKAAQLRSSDNPVLDGHLDESFWSRTSTVSLESFEISTGYWSRLDTIPRPSDINITWQALWCDSMILIGVKIIDDFFDHDNFKNDTFRHLKIDQDDGVQLFIDSQKNTTDYVWSWPNELEADFNFLLTYAGINSYFIQKNASHDFFEQQLLPVDDFQYAYQYDIETDEWYIEIRIKNFENLAANDTIWHEMVYHEADESHNREYRVAWNTHTENAEPWDGLGKLILDESDITNNEYVVSEIVKKIIPGKETYKKQAYTYATAVVISNYRAVKDSIAFMWTSWDNYNNAFVIFRALSDFENHILYLSCKVYDDHKFSSAQPVLSHITDEDALLLWVDFNNDTRYNPSDDVNVLLHSSGKLYQYNQGTNEEYDNLINPKNLKVETSTLPGNENGWEAEILLKLPASIRAGQNISVGLGYNDTDSRSGRESQLLWSSISRGAAPWKDFSNLGKFILGSTKPNLVNESGKAGLPQNFKLFRNYPNPFNSQTTISFSLKTSDFVTIGIYDLLGRCVKTLAHKPYISGTHRLHWDGSDSNQNQVSSGIYFLTMRVNNFIKTQKLAFIK